MTVTGPSVAPAERRLRAARLHCEERGDTAGFARCSVALGGVLRDLGRVEEALAVVDEAVVACRAAGQDDAVAVCQHNAVVLRHDLGEADGAAAALAAVRHCLHPLGRAALATCDLNLAIALHEAGETDHAVTAYEEARRGFVATSRSEEAALCERLCSAALAGRGDDGGLVGPAPPTTQQEPPADDRADGDAVDAAGDRTDVAVVLEGARRSLFREEALEHREQGRDAVTGLLRVDARWVRRSFWLLLVFVVAAVGLAAAVRVDETTTGAAVVDPSDGSFVALLPAAVAEDLEQARRLSVHVDGTGIETTFPAALVGVRAGDPEAIRGAGLEPPRQPSFLVDGVLTADRGAVLAGEEALEGEVRVVLHSVRLLDVIADRVTGMFGSPGR